MSHAYDPPSTVITTESPRATVCEMLALITPGTPPINVLARHTSFPVSYTLHSSALRNTEGKGIAKSTRRPSGVLRFISSNHGLAERSAHALDMLPFTVHTVALADVTSDEANII